MLVNEMLLKALSAYNDSRERSQQKQIGVSQLGGCRRQVWYQLQDTNKTNDTLKLPALMGTGIHKMIEEALLLDVKQNWAEYLIEMEVEYSGLKGHIDLFIPEIGAVIDWKTTKLKNLDYFPSKQQRWQVHTYAYLLEKNGYNPKTVTLVAIPRDGDERQIKIHTEEYSEDIAAEAWAWYQDIQQRTEVPEPERYAAQFCKFYCPYYGENCGGKGKDTAEITITDNAIIERVNKYLEVSDKIKTLESEKDGIKAALENINGVTPDGVKVAWSQIAGRSSIDEEAVKAVMGEVPKKQGDPQMRLTIK